MAIWKTVFIFRASANGWSELWYQDRSAIIDCIQPAKNVAGTRQALLGEGATLEAIRVSSIDRPYKSHIFAPNLDWNSDLGKADTAWNTLLARVDDSTLVYHRVLQLRGVPDEWIVRNALNNEFGPIFLPAAVTALRNYTSSLRTNDFRFKVRDQLGAFGTLIDATIFDVVGPTDRRVKVTATGVAGGPGDFVTFSGITGLGAADFQKGRHKIQSNSGTIVILATTVPADVVPGSWSTGKIRAYKAAYILPDVSTILRTSHRDTGRRFFVTRGRRSKRSIPRSTSVA